MKVGDTVIVRLGKYRGKSYESGFLPGDMLKDGAVTTVKVIPKSIDGWVTLEGSSFVYPRKLLLSYNKIRLLNAIKDFK